MSGRMSLTGRVRVGNDTGRPVRIAPDAAAIGVPSFVTSVVHAPL
jgi:hypothetical protein